MAELRQFSTADEFTQFFRGVLAELRDRFVNAPSEISRERLWNLFSQYKKYLRSVSADADAWIVENMGVMFVNGDAEGIVNLQGMVPKEAMVLTFTQVHEGALAEIVASMKEDYRKVIKSHENSLRGFISRISATPESRREVLQEIARSVAFGDSSQLTSKRIEARLASRAIGGYITAGNKTLRLDQYAELLARTNLRVAYTRGSELRYRANGINLVIISEHGTECKICGPIEGKIFSLSPNHPRYPHISSLPNEGTPLHPNCLHVELPFSEELADKEELLSGMIDKAEWPFKETIGMIP